MELRPVIGPLGVEAVGVDLKNLTNDDFENLYDGWLDGHVLLVREQCLDDANLITFTRRFGELDAEVTVANALEWGTETPGILVVSNVIEDGAEIGILGAGEAIWHTDMNFLENPTKASFLYALEVPESGGDTGFVNMELALQTLPEDLRKRIVGLSIKHDASTDSSGYVREGFDPVTDVRKTEGAVHPIVRRNRETDREALYLGRRRNAYVVGCSVPDSESLLDDVWAHTLKTEHIWYHKWRAGDLIVWDNRATMHYREPFNPNSRRIMHRTQVNDTPRPV
jgi:taurine dioxygenase